MKRESRVNCERALQDDVASAYLRGGLSEDDRDAFEQHYFECAACFERLQVMKDLAVVLRDDAPVRSRSAGTVRRPAAAAGWLAWAAGAAFVAVAAAVVLRNAPPSGGLATVAPVAPPSATATSSGGAPTSAVSPDRPDLDVLARVEPPPYVALVTRGGDAAEQGFARAMESYVRGEYAAAAAGLRSVLRGDPASLEAKFYLGVSELLAGRPEPAVRELRRVQAGDDPAFAEAASYYLAKAHLARREVAAARRELERVAGGEGDHKERAQRLLEALGAEP